MKSYKTYLFDFDGTLFDTLKSLVPVYQAGFAALGMKCSDAECAHFIHISLLETMNERGVTPEQRPVFMAGINAAINAEPSLKLIKMYPDVISTIASLKARGCKIGIVSGNSEPHMEIVLNRFHARPLFDVVVGNESFKKPKPSGEPCLAALKKLQVLPDHSSIYVGDSLQDPVCGEDAGLIGCLVDRGGYFPDYQGSRISSLSELI